MPKPKRDPAVYRFEVRFRGGRTKHKVREPQNGQWGGTLEAACGAKGSQNAWTPVGRVVPCLGCAEALADQPKVRN